MPRTPHTNGEARRSRSSNKNDGKSSTSNSSSNSSSQSVFHPVETMQLNKKGRYFMKEGAMGLSVSGKMLTEIRHLQHSTKLLLPKSAFLRVVREVAQVFGDFRFTDLSIEALQEAAETHLLTIFASSYKLTYHRKAVTLMPKDMHALRSALRDFPTRTSNI